MKVIGWEQALKEYYGQWLQGIDLRMAQEATSAARMR
ncbi:hypothetical protein SAMN05216604_106241 [Pseudomonas agarici]|nr:hypothetical protein SAMN05216604_106241 [Pseudomonas agarici]